jgi:hypothetical protein
MKKVATLFALLLMAATASPAAAQLLLLDYVGFDYESPNPNASQFGEVGSGYVGVGTVENLFAPLVTNTTINEYTYVISGLTSTSRSVYGDFVVVDYSAGMLRVYEQARSGGTPAQYGVQPPNATVPGNFTDGTLILEGSLTNFQVVFSSLNNSGSYNSEFTVTGGSQYGNIPPTDLTGWTFSGATGNALNIPLGYAHQIDGQVFLENATPTRGASWGVLKALYR